MKASVTTLSLRIIWFVKVRGIHSSFSRSPAEVFNDRLNSDTTLENVASWIFSLQSAVRAADRVEDSLCSTSQVKSSRDLPLPIVMVSPAEVSTAGAPRTRTIILQSASPPRSTSSFVAPNSAAVTSSSGCDKNFALRIAARRFATM